MNMQLVALQQTVWDYYARNGRHHLPWRTILSDGSVNPYHVLVSEIMLQQTQVARVLPKFSSFIAQFPDVQALALAPLAEVLRLWSGLGYNRRARFLHQTARSIAYTFGGVVPDNPQALMQLPGIGSNTAGAICAYAFNRPVVFIETNIRSVFIHHLFANKTKVTDKQIAQAVAQSLPAAQSSHSVREWYWAVMDYGTYLKQTTGNAVRRSAHYTKQSRFEGSRRQVRGRIVRLLTERAYKADELAVIIADERYQNVLEQLVQEGMVQYKLGHYELAGL